MRRETKGVKCMTKICKWMCLCAVALISLTADAAHRRPDRPTFQNVYVEAGTLRDDVATRAIEVFRRVVNEKAGQDMCAASAGRRTLKVCLSIHPGMPAESYEIVVKGRTVQIKGADGRALLYGLGKLLHSSYVSPDGFELGDCGGTFAPDKPVRGIYLATHFHNYYNDAPIEDVKAYIEELALWGYNCLSVWFDMHHYTGLSDPNAQAMIGRLKQLLLAGRSMGMHSNLTLLANEGYSTTPKELRAERIRFTAFYGCEICPSVPGGTELILKNREEMLDAFMREGVEFESVWLWPYDQGGCSCANCREWGGNGFLRITQRLSEMFRAKIPKARLVMSTWLFDFREQDKGEWNALARAFDTQKPWVDCIMADSHTTFPSYLQTHPVPGGLPLQNFPEISMWQNYPWGGYGANPLPMRFEELWAQAKDKVEGGFPYSEGKFEDCNKVLYSQFYWSSNRGAKDILREYVAHEFSPLLADSIVEAVLILEKNIGLTTVNWDTHPNEPKVIKVPTYDYGARRALDLMDAADRRLPEPVRKSWRWRIMLIRARMDVALRQSGGQVTSEVNDMFRELQEISSAQSADFCVRPPYKE